MTLQTYIDEGRLIRRGWTGTDAQGRHTACLLAALSPEVARSQDPADCPASIMPAWLAWLTPWIDDTPSEGAWPGIVQRYADLSRRWHVLDAAGWRRADYAARAAIVNEAARFAAGDTATTAACRAVVELCERVAASDEPPSGEWEAAREATADACSDAADAAWEAAADAEWSAREAAEVMFVAVAAASDRICFAVLDAIAAEITKAEAAT